MRSNVSAAWAFPAFIARVNWMNAMPNASTSSKSVERLRSRPAWSCSTSASNCRRSSSSRILWANAPCLRAFTEDRALPSGVFGPVDWQPCQ